MELSESDLTLKLLTNFEPLIPAMAANIEAQIATQDEADYAALTSDLSCGVVVDAAECNRILAAANKSMSDLQQDLGGCSLIQASAANGEPGWQAADAEPTTAQQVLHEIKKLLRMA